MNIYSKLNILEEEKSKGINKLNIFIINNINYYNNKIYYCNNNNNKTLLQATIC